MKNQKHSKYELDTSFLQSFDNFNDHVIQANKKIKDNFNEIISQNKQNFSNQFVDRSLEANNKIMFERNLEENLSESKDHYLMIIQIQMSKKYLIQ